MQDGRNIRSEESPSDAQPSSRAVRSCSTKSSRRGRQRRLRRRHGQRNVRVWNRCATGDRRPTPTLIKRSVASARWAHSAPLAQFGPSPVGRVPVASGGCRSVTADETGCCRLPGKAGLVCESHLLLAAGCRHDRIQRLIALRAEASGVTGRETPLSLVTRLR